MEKEMDDLSSAWKAGKQGAAQQPPVDSLIAQAEERKRSSLFAHYGNIAILSAVMVMVAYFFLYLYRFGTILSKAGVYTMIGGLAIRIVVEIFSVAKSKRIQLSDPAAKKASEALTFYNFRKSVHGPVTLSTVGLYIIGWFMLTPEFARYVALPWMIVLDGGFVVIAIVLIVVIRKGLRKEIDDLYKIVELRRQLEN